MTKAAVIAGCLVLLSSRSSNERIVQQLEWNARKPLHLGCERSQTHLYVVLTLFGVEPAAAGERLAVSCNGRTIWLRGLDQLRGYVQISDPETALRFVRLRTSLATWYLWPDAPVEVEIVAASRARSLPNFGLPGFEPLPGGDGSGSYSGIDGVLSDEDCRAAGFGPPNVQKTAGGFVVARWIYAEAGPRRRKSIQKIREYVGGDGSYQRTAIGKIDPHRGPHLFIGRYE